MVLRSPILAHGHLGLRADMRHNWNLGTHRMAEPLNGRAVTHTASPLRPNQLSRPTVNAPEFMYGTQAAAQNDAHEVAKHARHT